MKMMKKAKKMSESMDKKEDMGESKGIIDYLSKYLKIGGKHIGGQGRARDINSAVDQAVNPKSEDDMQKENETALQGLRKSRTTYRKRK